MSDEQARISANDEQGDEVEAHGARPGATEEPRTEGQDDEFEAHMKRAHVNRGA